MDERLKQTYLKGKCLNEQKAYENMFDIMR